MLRLHSVRLGSAEWFISIRPVNKSPGFHLRLQLAVPGPLSWIISPVSLLWSDEEDVDSHVTLTQFAVDPTKRGRYFLWKGSRKAPLLVYDPDHKGQITDGTQLFGNWTFGGKRTASLDGGTAPSTWRDGFEALATLDADGDGKISGPELEPLALWFDKNQNGVAEPGEVIPLTDLGVTALYYKPDRRDPITRSLIVTRGFERRDGRGVRTGAAVDWYSDSAMTREELLAKHLAHAALCGADPSKKTKGVFPSRDFDLNPITPLALPARPNAVTATGQKTPSIAGLWRWSVDEGLDSAKASPQGYFTIAEDGKGGIAGHSYVQVTFPNAVADATSMLSVSAFHGTRTATDGEDSVHFVIEIPNGTEVTNEARVLQSGQLLEGSSEATVNYEGKPISIRYRWKANKLPS